MLSANEYFVPINPLSTKCFINLFEINQFRFKTVIIDQTTEAVTVILHINFNTFYKKIK